MRVYQLERVFCNCGIVVALCVATISGVVGVGVVHAGDDPAHAIAEKFAGASREAERQRAEAERKAAEAKAAEEARQRAEARRAEAERKAKIAKAREEAARRAAEELKNYEKEMLQRARAEAEQRRAAAERARQEQAAREAAQQAMDAARKAQAAREAEEAARKAEAARHEQIKALARAAEIRVADEERRLEEEARKAAEQRAAQQRAIQERLSRGRDGGGSRSVAGRSEEDERRTLEAKRAAEAEAFIERLRRIRASRSGVGGPSAGADGERSVNSGRSRDIEARAEPENEPAPLERSGAAEHELSAARSDSDVRDAEAVVPTTGYKRPGRVSILLVMKPGNRGIRRWNKSADPVVCLGDNCYVSQGADKVARKMRRRKVLGTANTMGRRAWACVHKLVCAFRTITLPKRSVKLQPIDLRVIRHDRRAQRSFSADPSCDVIDGVLSCARTVDGGTWKAWIVPETVAKRAGARALEKALASGLSARRDWSAELR